MTGSMALNLEQGTARCRIIFSIATAIAISRKSPDSPPVRGWIGIIGIKGSAIDVAHEIARGAHRAAAPPRP